MSDRAYFQALYESALDFTMKAYYAAAVRERNNGVLGACQHGPRVTCQESSYGSQYTWFECPDCGDKWGHRVLSPW